MAKGVATSNLPATKTCRERGYEEGTVLASERWIGHRRVKAIRDKDVVLVNVDGHQNSSVKSLPKDVTRVQ